MRSKTWTVTCCAAVVLGLAPVPAVLAESRTVIESTPDKYTETRKGEDGTSTKLDIDRKTGSQVYKDSDGVVIKERVEDGKIKQDYRDDDCKRSAQQDIVTGDSRVVREGDCPK